MTNASRDDDSFLVKAKSDALRLLAVRPRSVEELKERLRQKKHTAAAIAAVVDSLSEQGILDDDKFAKLLAHSRVYSRPVGKKRLEIDLKKKGISVDRIERVMTGLGDYDEKEAAKNLVRVRFHKMTGISDEKKKARLFGFLARRGFSSSVIFSALAELFKDFNDNG